MATCSLAPITAVEPPSLPSRLDSIPPEKLKSLRKIGLEMKDVIKLGRLGVGKGIIQQIKNRWQTSEVAKLYCGGKAGVNMKLMAESLEKETGGVVVHRSGGSVYLANIVNEAALLARRQGQSGVRALDFDSAILRSVAGLEKKRSVLKGEEKAVVARHEVGHALVATAVAALVPMTKPVERLSIIPRSGGALGFTYSPPVSEDRVLVFENEIRGQLAMLMGGRAAEAATSASISTGAGDDIRRATDLAHRAVAEYGMSTAVGPLSVAALAEGDDYILLVDGGGDMSKSVEKEVRSLCESALAAARDVIELNRVLHAKISAELEREERLDGVALREVLEKTKVPPSLRKFVLAVGK